MAETGTFVFTPFSLSPFFPENIYMSIKRIILGASLYISIMRIILGATFVIQKEVGQQEFGLPTCCRYNCYKCFLLPKQKLSFKYSFMISV